ncbi:polyprenyl synthetase family protein [Lysinimonas soli]|uniref:Polyprenyl synthetase family protein n=1 Tax=Lysinimonas soli TaxID=1074233 RepID=A0ABW0NT37_9MICO
MTLIMSRPGSSDAVTEVSLRIEEFFARMQTMALPLGRRYAELWGAARLSSEGGKRFRPALVIDAYHALGGAHDDVITVATAFELLHTAFLLHDDVIDGDTTRRGRPNLAGTFTTRATERGVSAKSAEDWGAASAILAGDLLIHAAQAHIARLEISATRRSALLDLIEETMFVTAAGELADVAFATGVEVPELAESLSMTQWKTAHYSFQAPLLAGAILAGASDETLRALSEFGHQIGIAFQLRDDVLGVYGAEHLTGKSTSSDLHTGKMTPMMCYALQHDDDGELRNALALGVVTDRDACRVRALLERNGARAFTENLIDDCTRIASAALASPAVPASLRQHLDRVASAARERVS